MRPHFTRRFLRRSALALGVLAAVMVMSSWLWRTAYGDALRQLDRAGRADLALAADRLASELERFRVNAALTARRPEIAALLANADSTDIRPLLQELADVTGLLDVVLADARGTVLASARGLAAEALAGSALFERAFDGALGLDHLVSATYGRRVFRFAAPVFADAGPVIGAVVVVVDVEALEAEWRGGRPAVFFTDALGVVFVSNRSELLLANRTTGLGFPINTRSLGAGGQDIWVIEGGRYLPADALHVTQDLPVIGLTGEALLDVAPARAVATAQALAVAGALLALGAILFWALERRRTLARIAADLEARVARRTAELLVVNADLSREVAERRVAEAQLQQAQADLVQAGKLSALGQMSAGISHELNQPLMAIRSFAENAVQFLQDGKPEVAGQNLTRISELARRMGRIIKNLRAFSRQDVAEVGPVDLVAAVDAALEMAAARLHRDRVVLDWQRPAAPVLVQGGDVRLQQVVLNLISNAADAMEGTDMQALTLTVKEEGARVLLSVRDTGPGIAEPEKMFNPFYTTKQVDAGDGKGMGLGLSISYGLVQSFGGAILGYNHPEGGAIFSVELAACRDVEAAA